MLKLRSLAIELTPRCNQQCVYCYNAWRGEPASADSELSTDRLKTLVDRVLDQAELQRVTLTGGEPFLREDVFEIVDYLNGRDLAVAFISNGGVIGDEIAGHLASRRVDYVQITLAGPDASTHDAVCGAGSFERTTGAMRTLAAAGVAVGGSYLCTQHNATMAREIYETMLAAGARSHFAFNRFNPSGHAQEHMVQLMPSRGDVLTALSAADGFAAAHQCKVHCTMPIPRCMIQESDYPHIKFGQCAAGSTAGEFAVDPHGRL